MKASVSNEQTPLLCPTKPLLIVLSGPSGVGEDTVLVRMKASSYPMKYVTTLTTRRRRPNETSGIDYHFVSTQQFQSMMKNKELLEQAEVYGNWYGIPKDAVKKALENGEDTIVKIDIQGAATIKSILPQAVFIFLVPPSIGDLRRRLKQRHTELPSDFALRLGTAEEEMKRLSFFDYIVINRGGEIDRAVADITAIITAEKCRLIPREVVV